MSWISVALDVSAAEAQTAADRLQELGAASVTISGSGQDDDLVVEPAPGETPLWRRNHLQALFPLDTDLTQLRDALKTCLDTDTMASLDVGFINDDDWVQAWRSHAVQHLFGGRLWIAPKDAEMPDDVTVLRLEPGLAFGTGGHETTRLCLEWLTGWQLEGLTIMDYGCGSGILSIAACLLGARVAYAIDHDPQALRATRENATYNGVSETRLLVLDAEALEVPLECDVVLANILANPLIELAGKLVSMTRPGGKLVLSGLLAEQARSVIAAYPDVTFDESVQEGVWIRLVGTREPLNNSKARARKRSMR
ncbi:MAG: 50S ribosomal protein L11 methyltransferase [Gammaproteobacteria bacterium]|nr:50S ribosomal protein L11 methyltransferase [Gammaproteobacteria bacterium]